MLRPSNYFRSCGIHQKSERYIRTCDSLTVTLQHSPAEDIFRHHRRTINPWTFRSRRSIVTIAPKCVALSGNNRAWSVEILGGSRAWIDLRNWSSSQCINHPLRCAQSWNVSHYHISRILAVPPRSYPALGGESQCSPSFVLQHAQSFLADDIQNKMHFDVPFFLF